MAKSVFIVSGEESGDLHGAALINALKSVVPGLEVAGMGGERMRRAGMRGLDSRDVSVVGIVEVVEKLYTILKRFSDLGRLLKGGKFEAIVLIDFPDFNLRFAKKAKKLGIPIIYYISPQVWAWRKNRIKKIAALVDKMLVVFPFEYYLYKDAGLDVEYVGHPLADVVNCPLTRDAARQALGVPEDDKVVALLPGSRTGEIKRMLPVLLKAGRLIREGLGNPVRFLIPGAGSISDDLFARYLKNADIDARVIRNDMYAVLRASDAAAVTSGTATLETALIGTPHVIVYKVSPVSYGIARALIDVDHIGLPNIVAGKGIVPELIQGKASPVNISKEILGILTDGVRRASMENDLAELKRNLGRGGAARKAAQAIYRIMRPDLIEEHGIVDWEASAEEPMVRK